MLTTQDLAGLMKRVASRDRAAFAALYHSTSAKLFGIVLRILQHRDLAEDVLQEVYVKIWDRAADFDHSRASPITWMAAIARNRALDEVRRVKPMSIEDRPEILAIRDPAALPPDAMERNEDLGRLLACLEGLEPERRDLVRLAYINGMSREALAGQFGSNVSTVKTWLHRSLKQLKDCLGR